MNSCRLVLQSLLVVPRGFLPGGYSTGAFCVSLRLLEDGVQVSLSGPEDLPDQVVEPLSLVAAIHYKPFVPPSDQFALRSLRYLAGFVVLLECQLVAQMPVQGRVLLLDLSQGQLAVTVSFLVRSSETFEFQVEELVSPFGRFKITSSRHEVCFGIVMS